MFGDVKNSRIIDGGWYSRLKISLFHLLINIYFYEDKAKLNKTRLKIRVLQNITFFQRITCDSLNKNQNFLFCPNLITFEIRLLTTKSCIFFYLFLNPRWRPIIKVISPFGKMLYYLLLLLTDILRFICRFYFAVITVLPFSVIVLWYPNIKFYWHFCQLCYWLIEHTVLSLSRLSRHIDNVKTLV